MNVAPDAPKRPALRYYGGKWQLAPWIISHFPPHKNYVEPCGGAASVLLQKPRSPLETYNDLDSSVVNFFMVLRDKPDKLIHAIKLTPWAREEYMLAVSTDSDRDDVERARRFFVSSWMSMQGGHESKTGKAWRVQKDANGRWAICYDEVAGVKAELVKLACRLELVQIDNRDALDVIQRYDNDDALIYFDPPYLPESRGTGNRYRLEVDRQFHIDAAGLLRQCAGSVVVSSYASDLYRKLYEEHGWSRVDKEAQTNSGGKRIESLWLSPRTWKALHNDMSDLPLFSDK